jgi:hypothetical protein
MQSAAALLEFSDQHLSHGSSFYGAKWERCYGRQKTGDRFKEDLMLHHSCCGFATEGAASPKAIDHCHRFLDEPNARFCPLFAVEDRLQTDSAV